MFWNGSTARRFVGQRQHGFKLGLFPSGHAVDAHRPGRRALAWAEAPFGRRSTENLYHFQVQVFGYAQPPLPQNRSNQVTARLVNGRWAPGRSGNPGGRPGGVAEVRELARTHTAEAIECLLKEMRHGDTSHARIAAANAVLDRGWGRPTQPLAGDAEEPPIGIEMSNEERQRRVDAEIAEAFGELPARGVAGFRRQRSAPGDSACETLVWICDKGERSPSANCHIGDGSRPCERAPSMRIIRFFAFNGRVDDPLFRRLVERPSIARWGAGHKGEFHPIGCHLVAITEQRLRPATGDLSN